MISSIYGNIIALNFNANELTSKNYIYKLPDGYSVHQMKIVSESNISIIPPYMNLPINTYVFPIVNGKSPSTIPMRILDTSKPAYLRLSIEKFGGIPYDDYFNKNFEPILVTEEDGTEYKVIPSAQFK